MKKNDGFIVTIDVGGTGTKFNIYDLTDQRFIIKTDEDKNFQNKYSKKSKFNLSDEENTEISKEFVDKLIDLIDTSLSKLRQIKGKDYTIENIFGVGICVPAQVAPDGNIARIPAFNIIDLNLKNKLQEQYKDRKIQFAVINDVSMHTLGMYKALKLKNKKNIESLMVVSAGTATGIGIRLDALDNKYKLIYGSEFQFPANLLRGYGIRWSMENKSNARHCADLGWKTARKGIEDTFIERVVEILVSPTAIAIINNQNVANLFNKIMEENTQGYHLARRIFIECLDSDNASNYIDTIEENIEKKIENMFQNTIEIFKNSFLVKCKCFQEMPSNQKPRSVAFKEISDKKIGSIEIDAAANSGDDFARGILEECAKILGLSLSTIIPIIQPNYLVFAGGISKSKIWLSTVQKTIEQNIPKWYEKFNLDNCFLTPEKDEIKPSFCEGSTEVQLLGAVELIIPDEQSDSI